jgi:predicted transcriptional regulator of viral defense system
MKALWGRELRAVALVSGMREEVRHHGGLARLAGEQHGVVSHLQLLELGYSETAIGRGVESQRLHRIHRGAYAVGNPKLSNHGLCLAAVLACGRGAILSHDSAAWLWGLRPRCPSRTEVTLPSRGHRRSGIHIHHSTILEPVDRAIREGIPTTSVARTLLDCAARAQLRTTDGLLERAERLGLFNLHEIEETLARSGRHAGKSRLRKSIDLYREPAFTRAGTERRFLDVVLKAGLPRPAINTFVAGYEVDAFWERALRGRTGRLRDSRDPRRIRARPGSHRRSQARRHRRDPGHCEAARTGTRSGRGAAEGLAGEAPWLAMTVATADRQLGVALSPG